MSFSNETLCEILAGEIPPSVASELRLAVVSSTKFLDETIESLAMEETRSTAPVRILHLSPHAKKTESTQMLESYSKPQNPRYDGTRRSEPNWVQRPSNSADPKLLQFIRHFRVLRGNDCQRFRVTKSQLVKKQVQELGLHCCWQTRGFVHLFAVSSPGIEHGVFSIRNLHPDFDGNRVGQRSSDRGSFDFLVETKLFGKDKKTFRNGELAFIGVLEKDTVLYEIKWISKEEQPSPFGDIGELSYDSSESEEEEEEEVIEPQPSVVYHPVIPGQQSAPGFNYYPTPMTGPHVPVQHGSGSSRLGDEKVVEFVTNQLASSPKNARRVLLALQKAFKQEQIIEAFQEAGLVLDDHMLHQNEGNQKLRTYQKHAVEIVMNPGNFLLYAATGSGKTRIFIEVAKRILESKRDARVVVVTPKLALTTQHAKDFEQNLQGNGNFTVHTFSSATTGRWCSKWRQCSVAITTADYLVNRLHNDEIKFSEIELLILDEAHQAKGDSPYCSIMHVYASHEVDSYEIPTKVFGVTATPVHGSNRDRMDANFSSLLDILHVPQNHFVVIDDNNTVISQIIPQAKPETIEVEPRIADYQFIEFMASFLRRLITETLPEFFTSKGLSFLNQVAPPSTYAVAEGSDSKSQFQQWSGTMKHLLETHSITGFAQNDVEYALSTICSIQESVDNCRDVGFEEALSNLNERLRRKERDFSGFQSFIGQEISPERSLFLKFQALIAKEPLFPMLNKPTSNAGITTPEECGNFPKFAKLIEILRNYTDRDDVHGMVFVRTRLAADWIWKALQKSSLHGTFHFMKIVGRARRSNSQRSEAEGMDLQRQNEVLEEFRKAGKKIMVSTSVSEEGINVVSCDLIIRYNVALSGTEYKQSLGRARKRDARFVNIIEKGSKECQQLRRATTEEQESKKTIMMQPKAVRII